MYVSVIQTQYPPTSEFILKKTSLKLNYCYFYRLKNLLFLFLIYIYVKQYVFFVWRVTLLEIFIY